MQATTLSTTAHCFNRSCRDTEGHAWTDPETVRMYICTGHNENGGSEEGARNTVRIYCTCEQWVATLTD